MQQEVEYDICEGYYIIKYLGKGADAIVKMGRIGQEDVAIKFLKVENEDDKPRILAKLRQEASILEQLNHPSIAKLKQYFENLQYMKKKNGQIIQKIGMILELGQKGCMLSYLSALNGFDEQISRFYFHQLMSALVYLKTLNICHLDLKPENIVLDSDCNLKITDFGYSKQAQGLINDFFGGSKPYMAPEIWDKIAYDGSKVDVFAAGQILFVMITGSFAFRDCQIEPYKFIRQNDHQQFWNHQNNSHSTSFPQGFSEDFKDLINKMFDPDFNKRITPEECLEHPWTKGQVANLDQIQEQFNYVNQIIEEQLEKSQKEYERKQQETIVQLRAQQEMMNYLQSNNSQRSESSPKKDPMIEKKKKIMKHHNIKFSNRVLKKSQPTKMIDEILIYEEPQNLFCNIIEHFDKCGKIKNIHPTKYKLNVNIMENNEVQYQIQIELLDLGNNKLRVDVLNLGEDFLKFNKEIQKFKESIQQKQMENQIQQQ